jgi:ABC-type transport system involved in multi-copper enzyme maturation permease subunit
VRFREVFRFELAHTVRGPATWIYAALLFFFAVWILLASFDNDILFNAPIRLTWLAQAAGMFGLLVTAGLFGSVAVRDVEAGMDPLLYTTPLTKTAYLGGRFLAALAVNAILLLAIPLGQLAATLLWRRFEPELVGPLGVAEYLQAFPLLLIPSLLFGSGILFTIAMLARSVIPVYVGAIVLFISGIVAGNYAGRIDDPMLSALADPFAIATLEGMSRSWTPVEQNTRWIGFPAPLVWSRVALVALAAAALALLHRRFRFAHDDGGGRRRERRAAPESVVAPRAASLAIPRVNGRFDRSTWFRQTLAVARRCFAEVTQSRAFVVILLLTFGLTLLWGWNVGSTVFDTPVWPVTHLVATVALGQRNAIIVYLIISLYAGEMVWKDRAVRMAEIADAAPVSEASAVLGRYLAVVATLVLLTIVIMAAGLTIQTLQGYYDFDPGLYLRILFGIHLVTWALFAALAMMIHVVVNQKYVGHILMVAAVIVFVSGGFGIDHNLLIYAGEPGWTYSDMNGFGPFVGPLVWFRLYWAAWAFLASVFAVLLWVRGREPGLSSRLRGARARLRGATARATAVAITLILVLGGFIFYNTNVLNDYRLPRDRGAPQAEYEKRYERFENAPQPTIVGARLRAEIRPDRRAADLSGTFHLVNRTGAPVDSVHVYLTPEVGARTLSFDRPAQAVLVDEGLGYRIYALERALEPGDSLQLSFDVSYRVRGFPNSGIPTAVVENGAHFNRSWLPVIGYQPMLELSDPRVRRRFGLAPRAPASPTDSAALHHRQRVRNEDLVRVETIIGTAAGQIALTPGVLQRSWTENGRSYFHYDTEVPESFGATIISGRYAVREDRWNDVALRIYHHPTHAGNLDRVVRGMKASLAYFTEQFGPIRYRHLSIVEIPPYGDFGSAHPGMIAFSETFFGIRADEGDVDEPFYGTAHEVAHHWWGGQVRSAAVPGYSFLSESLANYSAMILTDKTYGPGMARRVYDEQMNRYLRGRAEQSREVPVLDVQGQPYIAYRKGALALMILRDHIGEDRVNAALRRYADRYRDAGPPFPTSRDLYAELRAVTPDSLHGLLADLFETITLWDLRTEQATVEPTGAGEYAVTLAVVGRKVRADSVGGETEVPMDDLVEIGVFAPGEGGGLGEPLYLKRHRIRSGEQTIRITVPREPARAGIDPYRKLFDRQRDDNVVAAEAARTVAGG